MNPADERLCFFGIHASASTVTQIAAIAVDGSLNAVEDFEQTIHAPVRSSVTPLLRTPHSAAMRFSVFLRAHATQDVVDASGQFYRRARLVTHNAAANGPRLLEWCAELGILLPAAPHVYCTLQRAYWLFEEQLALNQPENFTLETLCDYFGIRLRQSDAHPALAQVRATLELYRAIAEASRTCREAA